MDREYKNIVEQVIDAANGMQSLADQNGVSVQAVHQWKQNGRIPLHRVIACETASGIHRSVIDPIHYPAE